MTEDAREPVLLLPGLLCDHAVWQSQLEDLSDVSLCTVARLGTQDSVEAMARDALDAAPDSFSLVAHSMGGYVALEIMRRAPERVRRLALLSTQPRADTAEQADRRRGFIEEVRRGGFSEVIAGFPPLLFHASRLSEPALVQDFRVMAERVGQDAFLRQQRAIIGRVDSVAGLGAVACPTLVLCGRQDLITPIVNSELMAGAIPGAEFVVLEDCGHMTPVEQPVAVNRALRAWLLRPAASRRDPL